MKKIKRIITLTLCVVVAGLSSSCLTYYTVNTRVHSDGSLTKTVHGLADSLCLAGDYSRHPFLFDAENGWEMGEETYQKLDFVGDESEYNFYASRTFSEGENTMFVPKNEKDAHLAYLNGKEEWRVEKGFFADRYYYTCTFPGISGLYPLPIEDFVDEEDRKMLFREGVYTECKYMIGMEVHSLFMDAHQDYMRWVKSCEMERLSEIILEAAGASLEDGQKAEWKLLIDQKIREGRLDNELTIEDIKIAASMMSKVTGDSIYADMYEKDCNKWLDRIDEEMENIYTYPFTYAYKYAVDMPGKVTASNSYILENGSPVWKVDGFRLLGGDVTLTAESREVNIWSFAMLGLIVLCGIAGLFILRRKSKR